MVTSPDVFRQPGLIGEEKLSYHFLTGGGDMGERIRAFDWEATPLGAPGTWPQPLKISVRLLLSTGHPMLIWWGPDLIQFYNDAYQRSLGPERHPSALGQRGRECWEEIWPIIGHQIEQVMSGNGHTWNENQLVPTTRNGRREDIYWTYSYGPIDDPDAANGVGGVLVVCTETTKQVLAEQQMKAAEARWRELFTQAPGFICTLLGPEHRFEFANDGYYNLIGRRDIIGKTVNEVLPEVASQGFIKLLDEAYQSGKVYSGVAMPLVLANRSADEQQQIYVDFVFQPIHDANGDITGILIDGYDATERVHAAKTLQEEDRRKDEFLAMLAHELRNPLAPIRNASELLQRTQSQDPAMHTIGGLLARQVTQLTRLVDDLLDVSRITQNRVTLQREPLKFCDTIDLVIESLQDVITEKQHKVIFNRCDPDVYIDGDLTRIVQSFSNVLANAVKYTDAGGRIEITVTDANDMVVADITDNGTGISAEMLPKVFNLFVQAHRTLDRAQGGLGIGLSVVHRMIGMHGGDITAISRGLGQGATFRICLPTIEAPKAAVSLPVETEATAKRVLIVDDNVDAADSLAQLLQFKGHHTSTVYSAMDAMQEANAFAPDVILLDIGLPDMDGYEVAKRLRQKDCTSMLVAVTGYGQASDMRRGKDAGFDMHFTKPVNFADLEKVLAD